MEIKKNIGSFPNRRPGFPNGGPGFSNGGPFPASQIGDLVSKMGDPVCCEMELVKILLVLLEKTSSASLLNSWKVN